MVGLRMRFVVLFAADEAAVPGQQMRTPQVPSTLNGARRCTTLAQEIARRKNPTPPRADARLV
jgi:hypothetical protein